MKTKNQFTAYTAYSFCFFCCWVFSAQGQSDQKKWDAPATAEKLKNSVVSDKESLSEGKALYVKHCKSCHGSGGKGDGPKAASLEISSGDFTSEEFKKQSDEVIYWKTTEGRDPMPTFKKKLEEEERWEVVNYIRTLGEKK